MNTIIQTAHCNCYPHATETQLNNRVMNKIQNTIKNHINLQKHFQVIFDYHSPVIREVTKLFKNANLCFPFRSIM
jgi:hypothetical protein